IHVCRHRLDSLGLFIHAGDEIAQRSTEGRGRNQRGGNLRNPPDGTTSEHRPSAEKYGNNGNFSKGKPIAQLSTPKPNRCSTPCQSGQRGNCLKFFDSRRLKETYVRLLPL